MIIKNIHQLNKKRLNKVESFFHYGSLFKDLKTFKVSSYDPPVNDVSITGIVVPVNEYRGSELSKNGYTHEFYNKDRSKVLVTSTKDIDKFIGNYPNIKLFFKNDKAWLIVKNKKINLDIINRITKFVVTFWVPITKEQAKFFKFDQANPDFFENVFKNGGYYTTPLDSNIVTYRLVGLFFDDILQYFIEDKFNIPFLSKLTDHYFSMDDIQSTVETPYEFKKWDDSFDLCFQAYVLEKKKITVRPGWVKFSNGDVYTTQNILDNYMQIDPIKLNTIYATDPRIEQDKDDPYPLDKKVWTGRETRYFIDLIRDSIYLNKFLTDFSTMKNPMIYRRKMWGM